MSACGVVNDENEIDGRKIEAILRNKVGQYNSPKDLKDSIRMLACPKKTVNSIQDH